MKITWGCGKIIQDNRIITKNFTCKCTPQIANRIKTDWWKKYKTIWWQQGQIDVWQIVNMVFCIRGFAFLIC